MATFRYISSGERFNWPNDINSNIMDSNTKTSKISIMAPPGTVVQLKGEGLEVKKIMLGANGIYDFDVPEIKITEISFPATADQAQQKNKLEGYLRQIKESLNNAIQTYNRSNPPDYKNFCEQIKTLMTQGVITASAGSDGYKTLGTVILEYLSLEQDAQLGNSSLSNIFVNYIID